MLGLREHRPHGAQWLFVGAVVLWTLQLDGLIEAVSGGIAAVFVASVLVSIYNRERGQ